MHQGSSTFSWKWCNHRLENPPGSATGSNCPLSSTSTTVFGSLGPSGAESVSSTRTHLPSQDHEDVHLPFEASANRWHFDDVQAQFQPDINNAVCQLESGRVLMENVAGCPLGRHYQVSLHSFIAMKCGEGLKEACITLLRIFYDACKERLATKIARFLAALAALADITANDLLHMAAFADASLYQTTQLQMGFFSCK
jgi:hypothetical protein